ncbi:hypothetical protein ACEQ8H_001495 [Pleosporales sp. CAS-2024a]
MASWSNDYCLSCDRQMSEPSAYCSQACRLADLEKAGRTHTSQLSSSASSTASSNNGFCLPPAVNFSAYKAPARSKGFDVAPATATAYHYSTAANPSCVAPPQRSLTPSSSTSSLTSPSSRSQAGVSHQAATQLNNYVRSFDQTRHLKRQYTHY